MIGKSFTGGITPVENWYYIHKHQENIGLADGRKHSPNIVNIFNKERKNAQLEGIKSYKALWKANITEASGDFLNELFNDDDILTEFDTQIREQIQTNLNNDARLEKLMNIEKGVFDPQGEFVKCFNQTGQQIKSFNALLESFAQAATLLETPAGGALAAAIRGAQTNSNLKNMGIRLEKALSQFLQENEGKTVSEKQVEEIAKRINIIAQALKNKETMGGKDITKKSIEKVIGHVFNTGFAEGLGAVAAMQASKSLDDSFVSFTGSKSNALFSYDPGEGIFKEIRNKSTSGKADSKEENVHMNITYNSRKDSAEVTFNLGLSSKFYRTQKFGNLLGTYRSEFETGSGGITLGAAIHQIFGNSNYNNYLAYNITAHGSARGAEVKELNNLIANRFLVNFLATRGGSEDFAQYIIANGEVISIWEIFMWALDDKHSFKESRSTENYTQPFVLSIPDRQNIEKFMIEEKNKEVSDNWVRSREINYMISKAGMKGYLHVKKILDARKNIKK